MAVGSPSAPDPGELDGVVAFIAGQQARPERRISYVSDEAAGIAAELDGLSPPWATTVRVVRDGERIVGAVVTEWDEALGRAWVVGPWVADDVDDIGDDGDHAAWTAVAGELVDAALAQVPATVTRHEMSGEVAHRRLADLAAARGWTATEANHVLVADAGVVAAWPADAGAGAGTGGLRPASAGDVAGIAVLHDAEFPDTYATAAQLVEGQLDGTRVVLVADAADPTGLGGTGLAGYAAGEVHDDGEGFIDFVVVDPAVRRAGLGRRLVTAITRRLLERSSLGRVALTVQDHRTSARALYDRLGFRSDGSLVAYRSWR
jgi:ribosomal protein S18 acetylase RimI-like enzyme